ncbi:MAG: VWA containing CoxE family protein [Deltaproteobacteria bacterium]|nr:VWA containing CoxE family protein [Deltaproteobacteria bacterium]
MFPAFFHSLRALGVPVSLTEWLTLLEALSKGLHRDSLDDFYRLARSLLVKDVAHFDAFDQAFAYCFRDAALPDDLATKDKILEWLKDPLSPLQLSQEALARMEALTLDELLRELEDRLRKQEGPHHGGHHWVGTGGTSPFGAKGSHVSGISFDPDGGGGRAVLQAFARKYRNLRNDLTLDVRQIGVALKRLRDLRDVGAEEWLDLEATIDKTCKNAGEIDLIFGRERENQVRVLLVMDSGGSMEPFRELSERLFSAAHGLNHFKDFRAFYFHNCVYENLYTNLDTDEFVTTAEVIRECGKTYRLIVVGDAAMAPYELLIANGTLERRRTCTVKGIDWLRLLADAFPKRAWMNPLQESSWGYYDTVATVGGLFPMFPLTLEGLELGVRGLL